ncbi:hypothetical protein PRUPE_1G052000 [Prunus persica]|uniref:Uncharacterized protein n=1 Tax=Prunus persica TaxID=3760 RepID=M5Y5S5_PRUPE|nr:hypothetical protein PRUPE_1G052000 [Prunus persica]
MKLQVERKVTLKIRETWFLVVFSLRNIHLLSFQGFHECIRLEAFHIFFFLPVLCNKGILCYFCNGCSKITKKNTCHKGSVKGKNEVIFDMPIL